MDLPQPDLDNHFTLKARWADYYAAVLKERYPEAGAWLAKSHGMPQDDSAAIQARLERGFFDQEESPEKAMD